MTVLAISVGEPAGIGPDLIVRLAQAGRAEHWRVFADRDMLAARAAGLGLPLLIRDEATRSAGELEVHHVALARPVHPGRLDAGNARGVIAALTAAANACLDGACDALVTGPVQKSVIAASGLPFTGHTEFLQEHAGVADVLMLLVAHDLRVALATTHLPLRAVADAITSALVERKLRLLRAGLVRYFAIRDPAVAVTGLNPHAGEDGHLGTEDRDEIAPAVARARAEGFVVDGPLPADTLFVPAHRARYDAILAMYHDQGLPALKAHGFGEAVNVTLGLPYLRTSVDHGTALDRVGTAAVDTGSMRAALRLAAEAPRRAQ
jgi:4-hydroxythreonine-4-phosphate dehydrogenase